MNKDEAQKFAERLNLLYEGRYNTIQLADIVSNMREFTAAQCEAALTEFRRKDPRVPSLAHLLNTLRGLNQKTPDAQKGPVSKSWPQMVRDDWTRRGFSVEGMDDAETIVRFYASFWRQGYNVMNEDRLRNQVKAELHSACHDLSKEQIENLAEATFCVNTAELKYKLMELRGQDVFD